MVLDDVFHLILSWIEVFDHAKEALSSLCCVSCKIWCVTNAVREWKLTSKYFQHAEDILWIDLEDILEKTQPCIKCAIKPIKI